MRLKMICKYCGLDKPETDFKKCGVVKGITYYRNKCSSCKGATQKTRRQKNAAYLREYKKTQSCSKCGISDYRVLDFHHLDPAEKEIEVSCMGSFSIENLMKEIKKCIVLCANCHRIEHY
jgi:hypothetical protein